MFGDDKTVINNSTTLQTKSYKWHTIFSFHHLHEAIASGMVAFQEINPVDILSKHWGYAQIWSMLQSYLVWYDDTANLLY